VRLTDLDYPLPAELIAQTPIEPRDAARLMVVERSTGAIAHRHFRDLPELLAPGDLIVANDSRVMPARLRATKATGGVLEVLLLREVDDGDWEALIRGRVRVGTRLAFASPGGSTDHAQVVATERSGLRRLHFDRPAHEVMAAHGETPIPPYVLAPPPEPERYQTVYSRLVGSAAAPTAGLHFTADLIERLRSKDVGVAFVTLHVGVDTFRPVADEDLSSHPIHAEWFHQPAATTEALRETRARGGRVVAVGTTSVRVLESTDPGRDGDQEGWTRMFIVPGHTFRCVDALITNFHLPRTTLLALVTAFAGLDLTHRAYRTAIEARYRFYSFGDAMMIE
jgi:S-adenosylmethionine:tRNA ribosyltransferase-isomerase